MDCVSTVPKTSGVYALIFRLDAPLELRVGRLGRRTLPAGHLLYVGSAFGPGGLRARLARHLRAQKRIHWHIDALTSVLSPVACLCDASGRRLECSWAQRLAHLPDAFIPIPGFGSSDCRSGCAAHLIAFPPDSAPDLDAELNPSLILTCHEYTRSNRNRSCSWGIASPKSGSQ
ncbi:MAG TPA: GIY-YIG nuclease family protein [Caldilineae bacterium]|nr:GIY-YIG nuclease family protein [Caldilineae bacterium]